MNELWFMCIAVIATSVAWHMAFWSIKTAQRIVHTDFRRAIRLRAQTDTWQLAANIGTVVVIGLWIWMMI